jgi:polyferredoxin
MPEIKIDQINKRVDGSNSLKEKQENTRKWLAKHLVWLLIGIVLAGLYYILFQEINTEKTNAILTILSSVTVILGVILGFYFGQNLK